MSNLPWTCVIGWEAWLLCSFVPHYTCYKECISKYQNKTFNSYSWWSKVATVSTMHAWYAKSLFSSLICSSHLKYIWIALICVRRYSVFIQIEPHQISKVFLRVHCVTPPPPHSVPYLFCLLLVDPSDPPGSACNGFVSFSYPYRERDFSNWSIYMGTPFIILKKLFIILKK